MSDQEDDEYGDQNGHNYDEDDDEEYEDEDDKKRRSELDDYCGDDDEEEQEGAGTTNPSEMLEERILMLEQWMDEALEAGEEEDPALYEKHQEYLGMYEELEIIAKKLRKTDKLLGKQPSATKKKLEKKRNQYLREVEDIVSYVVGDIFFLDGEEEQNFVSQLVVTTNPLLGQPLESIIERPGMEDSQRFTLDNLPGFFATSTARLGSSLGSLGGSRGSFTKPDSFKKPSSTGQLGVKKRSRSSRKSKNDIIDEMLEEADNEDDPVFLSPVPRDKKDGDLANNNESEVSLDFREALLSPDMAGQGSSSSQKNNNSHSRNHHSGGSKDKKKSKSTSHSPPPPSSSQKNNDSGDHFGEIRTLQKKLKKVESLLSKPDISAKDSKKYEKKRREYMHSIEKLEYEVNSSIGSNLAADAEKEQEERRRREENVLRRKEEAERKRDELIKQQQDEDLRKERERLRAKEEKEQARRAKEEDRRRKEEDRQRRVEEEIRALGKQMYSEDDQEANGGEDIGNNSRRNKGPLGTKEDYELLKKKYEKAKKLVNNAITLKEAKKFEKKCKEYLAKLEEYEDWNWEVNELEKLNKKDEQRHRDYEEKKRLQKQKEEEDARLEEERRKEDERWLNESTKSEQLEASRRSTGSMDASLDGYNDAAISEEEAAILKEDHRIVEKKLKKVEKLMKELVEKQGNTAYESKDYHKYEKKKKQYQRELGAMEESFRGGGGGGGSVGGGQSMMGESMDTANLIGDLDDYEDYGEEDYNYEEDEKLQAELEAEAEEELRRKRAAEEEWQRRQEEKEEMRRASAGSGGHRPEFSPEELEAIDLLRKKLRKVEKLMKEATNNSDDGPNSREFGKLQKKKKQYLEELE